MMGLRFLKAMNDLHARPRWLKTAGWLAVDFYFGYGGFNQVTGREYDAVLFSAIVMSLIISCGVYPMPSATFTPKTYATLFSCSLLGVIAYQAMVPITGTAPLTPAQAWGIVLYMLPAVANRFNVNTIFSIIIPDLKLPPEQRMHAKRKAR